MLDDSKTKLPEQAIIFEYKVRGSLEFELILLDQLPLILFVNHIIYLFLALRQLIILTILDAVVETTLFRIVELLYC